MVKGGLGKVKRMMIKKSQDHHHLLTQEFDILLNMIIPSTIFLVI
jgi:hypothetical protein